MIVVTEQAVSAQDLLGGRYTAYMEVLPPGFPYRKSRWENDDRSLCVSNLSGSAWCRVYEAGSTTQIAYAFFAADSEVVRCDDINVDELHRHKGIANALYRLVACYFGAPIVPSDRLLDDGIKFWHGRTEIIC